MSKAAGDGVGSSTSADVLNGAVALEDAFDDPTAGAVLGHALAKSSEKFLLNDAAAGRGDTGVPLGVDGLDDETERVHDSRVALRRMRSNLRTFRLLVDPAWGTSLRAELAWYADRLGETRDLHVLRDRVTDAGEDVVEDDQLEAILLIVDNSIESASAGVDDVRGGERHARLTKEILRACQDPPFTDKAERPADLVMGPLLQRTWHDVRGAARLARKKPTDDHLHKLRIRLKGLRYGAETVALVDGSPARKTARAVETLQIRLGDLHDVSVSRAWLATLADERPELAESAAHLSTFEEAAAVGIRKGWRKELKEVERRWRRWQD
ncbi:MAG TPA: CHAD domain-containing protein [Acidimicrobiales bacterium]|nr:CHAD domain-containing protein [Acidimicrobiales bacterium]